MKKQILHPETHLNQLLALFTLLVLLIAPAAARAQALTLANPHWNITLTDAGYSDFLLDNTPGFEGREYLSGEWGGAVGYQLADSTVVSPRWFERQFSFPDWVTDSDFGVKSPVTQTALNADNLPIAQAILTNAHLEITLRHEMLDTVVGTPMGTVRASASGAGASILSSRYVLKQTCTVKNISGGPLANVQLFQFIHSLNAQHGVYDAHAYSGTFSNFQYDVTLAGVDPYATGTNSSASGLEDYLGFASSVAPDAWEIGAYGIEGNGVDDHCIGKPSDGVHLSIENNWLTPPLSTRLNRDEFIPAQRWVSGAERWTLGALAVNQSASLDILLSLRTGTRVSVGTNSSGGCNGGSGVPGGLDYEFDYVTHEGSCFGGYSKADETEVATRIAHGEFEPFTFMTPGGPEQIWEVSFNGTNNGLIHLTFAYDPTILPAGLDQSTLVIYHFHNHAWELLTSTVDLVRHTITVTTPSLSAFALGVSGGTVYNLNVSAAPISGGTVTGGGTFASGANVTLIATASPGYVFTNWTEGAAVVSSSPTYSFQAGADRTLEANFISAGGNVTIATSSQPTDGGSTLGDGAYAAGTSATVIAIPNPGYKFSKWMVGNTSVSSLRTNTFTVSTNRVLVAKFKPVYTVTVSADPADGGSPEADSSKYEPGEIAKMSAHTSSGWCFLNWTQNGVVVSPDPNFTFTVTANRALVGHYAFGTLITATPYPANGGNTSGGGVYQEGSPVQLSATAKPGYAFLNWTEKDVEVSTSASYAFTAKKDQTLQANFVAAALTNMITVSASPVEGGTVSGGGYFANGVSATVIATTNAGYNFINWTEGTNEVSTATSYTFTVSSSRDLVANFSLAAGNTNLVITLSASPAAGGTVSGGGYFSNGVSATVIATTNAGYNFVNWTEGTNEVSTAPSYTFTVTGSRDLVANFSLATGSTNPVITVVGSPLAGGFVSGDGTYTNGDSVYLYAAAEAGYAFVNWTENGTPITTWNYYSFMAETNRSFVAHFAPAVTITTSASSTNGTTGGDGEFPTGASVGVVAAPATGFTFVNWTEDGVPVSSNAGYTFTAGTNRTLVAHFAADLTSTTFDFDTATPALTYQQTTPLTQTVAGLVAEFSSTADPAFSVANDASNYWVMPKFSGNYLAPSISPSELLIHFSHPLTSIALSFATFDWQDILTPTPLLVEAFLDKTNSPAGSVTNTGAINYNDTAPVCGRITLNSGTPFNLVHVSLPTTGPLAATDFTLDNITVTTIPSLNIHPGGGGLTISWPVTETYVLEKSASLAVPNWTAVTSGVVTVGNEKQFTETSPTGTGYFRLVRP